MILKQRNLKEKSSFLPDCVRVVPRASCWSVWAMSRWAAGPSPPLAGPSGWLPPPPPAVVSRRRRRVVRRLYAPADPAVWQTRGRGACSSRSRCGPGAWAQGPARSPPCPRQPGTTRDLSHLNINTKYRKKCVFPPRICDLSLASIWQLLVVQ